MNADRDLLELAAKAIGLDIEFPITRSGEPYPCRASDMLPWNPLTDDGDALRLAVTLKIDIYNYSFDAEPYVDARDERGLHDSSSEPYGEDHSAATRRVIVRAAAEIGKAMP